MSTATVAVIASTLMGLSGLVVGYLGQRQGRAHEREISDLEAVRSVLAEAAAVLHRSEYALDEALSALRAWGAAFFEEEGRAKPYFRLEEIGREADLFKGGFASCLARRIVLPCASTMPTPRYSMPFAPSA
jgi:hypothetical protein